MFTSYLADFVECSGSKIRSSIIHNLSLSSARVANLKVLEKTPIRTSMPQGPSVVEVELTIGRGILLWY